MRQVWPRFTSFASNGDNFTQRLLQSQAQPHSPLLLLPAMAQSICSRLIPQTSAGNNPVSDVPFSVSSRRSVSSDNSSDGISPNTYGLSCRWSSCSFTKVPTSDGRDPAKLLLAKWRCCKLLESLLISEGIVHHSWFELRLSIERLISSPTCVGMKEVKRFPPRCSLTKRSPMAPISEGIEPES